MCRWSIAIEQAFPQPLENCKVCLVDTKTAPKRTPGADAGRSHWTLETPSLSLSLSTRDRHSLALGSGHTFTDEKIIDSFDVSNFPFLYRGFDTLDRPVPVRPRCQFVHWLLRLFCESVICDLSRWATSLSFFCPFACTP